MAMSFSAIPQPRRLLNRRQREELWALLFIVLALMFVGVAVGVSALAMRKIKIPTFV